MISYIYIAADDNDIISSESLQIDVKTIEAATDQFSETNKIGQGGFGVVYKVYLSSEYIYDCYIFLLKLKKYLLILFF